jgi:muramoyltetrapeptide carboxypeptidase
MQHSSKLATDDRVRLIAPRSPQETESLDRAIEVLQNWGLTVEVGTYAPDPADQLAELNAALRDTAVRAIVITGGAAEAYRIADRLDFDAARRDPKPIVGVAGTTHLHLALWRECRIPGIYGVIADEANPADEATIDSVGALRRALMTTAPMALRSQPDEISATVRAPGTVTGPLLGGNLTAIRNMIGAGLPDLDGAILLLEDRRTIGLGQVDRQLTHLLRSRALEGVRGIALGRFPGFEGFVDREWTLADVLRDRLTGLGVPVLGGLRFGNGFHPVPVGAAAVLDADEGTLIEVPSRSGNIQAIVESL